MMKRIRVYEAEGKTVRGIAQGDYMDTMAISFTDGTFVAFKGYGYGDESNYLEEIEEDDRPEIFDIGMGADMIRIGIYTQEERDAHYKSLVDKREAFQRTQELETLRRLKEKYPHD